jgi:pyridoxine 5-phosphate synthase
MAAKLSVNLNKIALLRNSRGGQNPSPATAAEACIRSGAEGITLHWREDNRHTRADDVRAIAALCKARGVEFNLEGDERDELVALALEVVPTQFTLVPVTPGEITSDHGWDLPREGERVSAVLSRVAAKGIRTAIFMDPVAEAMAHAADTGADRVEIYTEPYASAFGTERQQVELERVAAAAEAAVSHGLGVNAGHDLDLRNMPVLARRVPELAEVSIGHALVADALYLGLEETVRRYLAAVQGRDVDAPVTW